jgi:RHS repeat-associated protein
MCEARDGVGSVLKRYFPQGVQDSGIGYIYMRDHLGNVRELVDSSGIVRARCDYDPWGRRTKMAGDKDSDSGFTGHYEHVQTGLTLAPMRAYDTSLGRWISEDPIGLEGDGPNFYSYVLNESIAAKDPLGEFCIYDRKSGQMSCWDDKTGDQYYDQTGYSGKGDHQNKPEDSNLPDEGPIPAGMWKTSGGWHDNPNTGPGTMNLTPLPDNSCFGTGRDCGSFRLHGDKQFPHGDKSTGCIVLPPDRKKIHRDETIEVR